ncbi:MAG: hypothetical protein IT383_19270 [Deltaproteobacteria bacterium]|nr:hypothetical protein [Deltaproteobacteria bacterium]
MPIDATPRSPRATNLQATRAAPDIGRPASTLPRFDVARFWDADSTPACLACASRALGTLVAGARTPEIEAAIVMASLMHDVAYYYGGNSTDRDLADDLFGRQIRAFVARLKPNDPEAERAAARTAAADVAAVQLGGGFPFGKSYSWSYGFDHANRGYASHLPDEAAKIRAVAREAFTEVVRQIAAGDFELSDVLKEKLATAKPEYQARFQEAIVRLAKSLRVDLQGDNADSIPGF